MDTKIAVIEDNISKLSDVLGYKGIEYNNQTDDNLIHEWLIPKISALDDVEKLIIPIRLGIDDADLKGLRIGLHIRLSTELDNKRFLPLIFIAEESRDFILNNQIKGDKELTAMLLFTPGVYLTPISELLQKLQKFNYNINREILLQSVLPNLIVENQKDLGHQVANEWGVFRLAKFAGIPLNIKPPRDLYFKYKYAYSESDISTKIKSNIGLVNSSGNILLIDDNADLGWSELLKNIFLKRILSIGKKFDLTVIKSFEEANTKTDYEQYDTIFLDLRLKPEEDKPNSVLPIEEFSGFKLLKKIKTINQGIQVIIITASNKAWNMKRLLEEGADGYYIKESPEFNFPDSFSEENYKKLKEDIEKCFKRKYLKEIYNFWDLAKKENTNPDNTFIQESNSLLNIAWNLIHQEQLDFGYLTLFQIIELYANQKYDYSDNSIELGGVKNYMIEVDGDNEIWKLTFNRDNRNGDYFSSGNEQKNKGVRVYNLYKASCLLKYCFNKNDAFLREFGNLNDIRNEIAHKGAKGQAKVENTKKVLEIIKMIRQ